MRPGTHPRGSLRPDRPLEGVPEREPLLPVGRHDAHARRRQGLALPGRLLAQERADFHVQRGRQVGLRLRMHPPHNTQESGHPCCWCVPEYFYGMPSNLMAPSASLGASKGRVLAATPVNPHALAHQS